MPPSHGGGAGSIPVGNTILSREQFLFLWRGLSGIYRSVSLVIYLVAIMRGPSACVIISIGILDIVAYLSPLW